MFHDFDFQKLINFSQKKHYFIILEYLYKTIGNSIKQILASGTSERYPDFYNTRLKVINAIFCVSILIQFVGVLLLSFFYTVSLAQYIQTFAGIITQIWFIYLHHRQKFQLSKRFYTLVLILGIIALQIFYKIAAFPHFIFFIAAGVWHYIYIEDVKKLVSFLVVLFLLSMVLTYFKHIGWIVPFVEAKSEVFNGRFASFAFLFLGVVFFIWNAAVYKNEIQKSDVSELSLCIKRNGKTFTLLETEILFLKSDRNYVEIHTRDKRVYSEKISLTKMKNLLSEHFIQTHKSFLVNQKQIHAYGIDTVVLKNQIKLPLGRSFKQSTSA